MRTLSVDIETFSRVDLMASGVYRYVEDAEFRILLFAYAFDDEPVRVVDLTCDGLPDEVYEALEDPSFIKTAYNANFEITCINQYFVGCVSTDAEQWRCTSVQALELGLPNGLDKVAKALNLEQQKDTAGKALIRYFSCPCLPTATNGGRERNLPNHDEIKWEQFKAYCKKDVEVERAVRKAIEKFPISDSEQKLWVLDQKMNNRGVAVDMQLVGQAIRCSELHSGKLMTEALELTGLDNPNSVAQIKNWLLEAEGLEVESLNKKNIPEIIDACESDVSRRVLEIRQELAKTSVTKYSAIARSVCEDGRVRGLLQFYGANRTGRFAGRIVQIHNLPKNYLDSLDAAREFVRGGDFESVELLYDKVPNVLSQLIRTAFVPDSGEFIVADFSAIEARVTAWLAGERWRLDVFAGHGKIYEASASAMFGVPIEDIGKGSPLRQKGKISELSLSYGGSIGALTAMGALDMGIPESELPELVSAWRQANPKVVSAWRKVEQAALMAVKDKTSVVVPVEALDGYGGITFSYKSGILFVRLPSGRSLSYVRPQIETGKFGNDCVSYEGYEAGRWSRVQTFGGKIWENIVQAVSRDCLAVALTRVDALGYDIAFHVHDEIVCVGGDLERMITAMTEPIEWAKGLLLKADGFTTRYYQKEA